MMLLQVGETIDVVSRSFDQHYLVGIIAALVVAAFGILLKDRADLKSQIKDYQQRLDQKQQAMTALQSVHNEKMLEVQREMINAMNNQNVVIKGVEVLLQSIKRDVESLKK